MIILAAGEIKDLVEIWPDEILWSRNHEMTLTGENPRATEKLAEARHHFCASSVTVWGKVQGYNDICTTVANARWRRCWNETPGNASDLGLFPRTQNQLSSRASECRIHPYLTARLQIAIGRHKDLQLQTVQIQLDVSTWLPVHAG